MPVAYDMVPAVEVWLDELGVLHEGATMHKIRYECGALGETVYMLDANPHDTHTFLLHYGDNLTQLRLAFNGEEAKHE